MKNIKFKNYYALLCCSSKEPLLCGVYASRREAKEVNQKIKDCPATHKIIKVDGELFTRKYKHRKK